jgi:hypothetical protein
MPRKVPLRTFAAAFLLTIPVTAQLPLPELRIEPTTGGSIFYIKNVSSQPLSGYLIELVNYPGSSYSFWQDEPASAAIPPGGEKRISVANMTVGAVPEYVKMQAALYADGTSSGIPEKITQLIERRRFTLETTRELIRRLEKAQSAGTAKATVIADLKQWAETLLPQGKANRISQATVNQAAARTLVADAVAQLDVRSLAETLTGLRASERTLAASKPAL